MWAMIRPRPPLIDPPQETAQRGGSWETSPAAGVGEAGVGAGAGRGVAGWSRYSPGWPPLVCLSGFLAGPALALAQASQTITFAWSPPANALVGGGYTATATGLVRPPGDELGRRRHHAGGLHRRRPRSVTFTGVGTAPSSQPGGQR